MPAAHTSRCQETVGWGRRILLDWCRWVCGRGCWSPASWRAWRNLSPFPSRRWWWEGPRRGQPPRPEEKHQAEPQSKADDTADHSHIPSVITRIGTHMVNEFSHHAVPLPLVILSSVFAIRHQFYLIGKAQNVGELFEEVQAVTLKAIISIQRLIRFLIHHVRIFLGQGTL